MDQETQLMQALARLISNEVEAQKQHTPYGLAVKASGTPSETAYLYETGGLFGRCDGPSTLVNAMVGPIGVEKVLQWVGTDTEKDFPCSVVLPQ